ncbi:MAG TPA: TadE/TadG family type IV pilus assembly protein [Rhizomicrobium sp.]|nr:TadE/TadG family type IV pilus assembly protein [Rhizomicrobium sp.]
MSAINARLLLSSFVRSRRANVAMIFGLALVPIMIGAGVGLDMARAMIVRSRLTEALDAAGLAVGGTTNLSQGQMQTMAQRYFDANYTTDKTQYGTPTTVSVAKSGQTITLTTNVPMPTTLMRIAGMNTLTVHATSQITFGQTKLRVALVLDNTGSMTEADSTGLTKISALKTATHSLLTLLKNAATNAGDVQVSIIPFSKAVNYGNSNPSATWIDWTDWDAAPSNGTPSSSVGPGSTCPYSSSGNGYRCTTGAANGSSTTSTIPSSGLICPGKDGGNVSSYKNGHYYNGCYDSVATVTTGTPTTTTVCTNSTNCTTSSYCSGYPTSSTSGNTVTTTTCQCVTTSGSRKTCTRTATPVTTGAPYSHTWIPNAHSTWGGCFMDRTQDYDISNTSPTTAAAFFPAENTSSCPGSTITALNYNWTTLNSQVDAMVAAGSTNQPIGLAWGWQSLSSGNPFNTAALPSDTSQVIIILSDGLNTQDRWYGDGANQASGVDDRMSAICTAVKRTGTIVYSVFVHFDGSSGNSTVMQNCATDTSKFFDISTSASISTVFATIGQQITNLRVSR